MRDPHVVALYYRLETTEALLSFENPPPREDETALCTFHLANDRLTCTMKAHYDSVDKARKEVGCLLRAWELADALQRGRREIRFIFQKAQVIDRDPPPGGQVYSFHKAATRDVAGRFSLRAMRPEYPAFPQCFTVSPDVETLWYRYEGYVQGREPLLAMANACLTFLTAQVRGRENVAKTYAIDLAVLRKLDDFAANLGDERTARKFHAWSARREPTAQEAAWIDAAIRMIIHRVGEHTADPTAPLSKLRMSDLPPL